MTGYFYLPMCLLCLLTNNYAEELQDNYSESKGRFFLQNESIRIDLFKMNR